MTSIIGRESELESLMGQLSKAISGEGGLVLISGEAGSGKTELCDAFERMASKDNCVTMVGRCVPGARSPYLPFIEAFSSQTPNPFASNEKISSTNESVIFLSILDYLEHLTTERVLILRLEDLHWADSASIPLLHFLARNAKAFKVLIVGTYRPEDLHPSSFGEPHPLKESLRIMRREGLCEEIELGLLKAEEIKKLAVLRLGGGAEEPLLEFVAKKSEGNPLFAVEMIRFLIINGQIKYDEGTWRLQTKQRIKTPATVREVILTRTSRLPKEARQIIEFASVIGERFERNIVEETSGIHGMRLFEAFDIIEQEYNLIMLDEEFYKFSHEIVRQVIYDEISVPRRSELHRLIGVALERRILNGALLAQLSWHFDQANDIEKSIKYSLSAGKHCYRKRAFREAKSYFLIVLRRADEDNRFIPERLTALESLGDLKNDASSLTEWYSYYEQFLVLNQDRRARARVLAKAAECLDQAGLANPKKAFELLEEAESLSSNDSEILANVEYRRADLYSSDFRIDDALSHIVKARHLFDKVGDSVGALRCGELEVIILRQGYRLKEAKELAERQLQLARNLGDYERFVVIEMLVAFICVMVGDTEPAKTYASEVIELANKLGMTWSWRLALQKRALALELEGDLESAKNDVSRALENAIELESPFHAALCEIDLGLYESELGHQNTAEYHYEEASKRAAAFCSWPGELLESDLSILKAELFARIGAYIQSDEVYQDAMTHERELKHPYELMNTCSRYGIALSRRGMQAEAHKCFTEAMDLATKMGCEKRVRIFATRACIKI